MVEELFSFYSVAELRSFCPELRFGLDRSIAEIKAQLSRRCGTAAESMNLALKDDANNTLYSSLEDDKLLGYYSPSEGLSYPRWMNVGVRDDVCRFTLHVVDLKPMPCGWLEDVNQVEKYTMPDEQYDKLTNSFRAYKKQLDAANPENTQVPPNDVEIRCDINVDDRCQVDPGEKRGIVRFVGNVPQLKPGVWIGIEYDEPLGKNDGSVEGERLFTCAAQHGAFVRPTRVRVGDFPPFDVRFDDEI